MAPAKEGWLNAYVVKEYAYKNFVENNLSTKQRNDFRINKFKEHVEAWCRYYGYKFNPPERFTDHDNNRILKYIPAETKSMECFYIDTSAVDAAADGAPAPDLPVMPGGLPYLQ